MGLQQPILEKRKAQRLSPCGGVGTSVPKNPVLKYSYLTIHSKERRKKMLLTKEVEVAITSVNVSHYRNKGYDIPTTHSEKSHKEVVDIGAKILVKVEDLPIKSHIKIQYQCDICKEIFTITYADWTQRKHQDKGTFCKNCAAKFLLPQCIEEKYGETNVARVDSVIEKKKQTNLEKYGNEWAIASDTVRGTIETVIKEKYGVDNCMKNKDIRQKARDTCIDRYGGASPLCDEKIKEKARSTCLEKYGVPNCAQSKEVQAKMRATLYENGTTPSSKAEKKMCELLKEMFGVENCFPNYPCDNLSLDCLVKINENKIDVEYDGSYWHKERAHYDGARNAVLMNEGYKIVRIKANNTDDLPTKEQIQDAIDYLVKDNHHITFIDMNI